MNEHVSAPLHLFLMVLAVVLFFIAAFAWPVPVEPWRVKIVAGGLFCWALASFL